MIVGNSPGSDQWMSQFKPSPELASNHDGDDSVMPIYGDSDDDDDSPESDQWMSQFKLSPELASNNDDGDLNLIQ